MTFSKPNATAATLTKLRTGDDLSPFSGMCVTCIEGCIGLCEIGRSAYRGAEVIYPQPFGPTTSASQKDYPLDFSHFNIMGTAVGAKGIEADSDKAIFSNVNLELTLAAGRNKGIKCKLPFVIPGLGSTDVAKRNWEGLAIGSAISGTILTIGENVCGMDDRSVIKGGKILKSPELEKRVNLYKDWQNDYGAIVVQANVEDGRLGVHDYAINTLGVEVVELKWGQGAKTISGEVKLPDPDRARLLKSRGYLVFPDPEDPDVIDAWNRGAFKEFERHSRVGMVDEESFLKEVARLRKVGAKYIFLKTGAYRPADLARAMKFASLAKIDVLTVDGAGGGTGMSPWRMMNEWGIPTLEIASLTYQYAKRLSQQKEHVPDIVLAGGIVLEDQIYKALALGAPYFKAVGMARSPIAAAMVGKTLGRLIQDENIPASIEKYGASAEEIFITSVELKKHYGKDAAKIPPSAIGLFTYYQRLAQGLRQFMGGARKFALQYISRDDLVALTRMAADASDIPYVMEADKSVVDKILGGKNGRKRK